MAARAILLVTLAAFLLSWTARADDAPKYVGSKLTTDDAVKQSDAIFVGVITNMGERCLSNGFLNAGIPYAQMKVNVIKVFRGKVGPQVSVTTFSSGFGK